MPASAPSERQAVEASLPRRRDNQDMAEGVSFRNGIKEAPVTSERGAH